jgi:hypothetical protein
VEERVVGHCRVRGGRMPGFRGCVRGRAIPSGFAPTSHFSRHVSAGLLNAAAFAAGVCCFCSIARPRKSNSHAHSLPPEI